MSVEDAARTPPTTAAKAQVQREVGLSPAGGGLPPPLRRRYVLVMGPRLCGGLPGNAGAPLRAGVAVPVLADGQ
jgi:hypothetical protein